ncbi:MAG TPA: hypothetical protein VFT71_02990 [Candidatus Nitrosocosmicus sp.]|nr:hypothetical protein [Candidatus Nitrosocosmicus sp.]
MILNQITENNRYIGINGSKSITELAEQNGSHQTTINQPDCERVRGPIHNQIQHYGGIKDE